jgi:hypothetical protein
MVILWCFFRRILNGPQSRGTSFVLRKSSALSYDFSIPASAKNARSVTGKYFLRSIASGPSRDGKRAVREVVGSLRRDRKWSCRARAAAHKRLYTNSANVSRRLRELRKEWAGNSLPDQTRGTSARSETGYRLKPFHAWCATRGTTVLQHHTHATRCGHGAAQKQARFFIAHAGNIVSRPATTGMDPLALATKQSAIGAVLHRRPA